MYIFLAGNLSCHTASPGSHVEKNTLNKIDKIDKIDKINKIEDIDNIDKITKIIQFQII